MKNVQKKDPVKGTQCDTSDTLLVAGIATDLPENTIKVPGSNSGFWTKGQKTPFFRKSFTRKLYRKKIPEIAIVLSTLSKLFALNM